MDDLQFVTIHFRILKPGPLGLHCQKSGFKKLINKPHCRLQSEMKWSGDGGMVGEERAVDFRPDDSTTKVVALRSLLGGYLMRQSPFLLESEMEDLLWNS